MKKKIVLVVLSILVLLVAFYSGYWFFKAHQIKKQISLLSENDGLKFSTEEIKVEGFPLSQKIIIKNFRLLGSKTSHITIKNFQIESTSFSNKYAAKIFDPIEIEDSKNNISSVIELSPDTVISLIIDENQAYHINIIGSGYKVLDKATNKVMFILETKSSETKISILDNHNIRYQYQDLGSKVIDEKNNAFFTIASSIIDIGYVKDANKSISVKLNLNLKEIEYSHSLYSALKKSDIAKVANEVNSVPENVDSNKNNFALSSEITLVPNKQDIVDLLPAEQMAQIPDELKSQYRSKPLLPFSGQIDLQSFEFSNSLYKILISGLLSISPDDIEPSGSVVLKVENIDNLAQDVFAQKQKFSAKSLSKEKMTNQELEMFYKLISTLKELGAKNSLSQNNFLVFDIKREKKGANFKINETTFSEILMNFMRPNKVEPSVKSSFKNS